jgi:predicted PurR-regulated permease PerM
MSLQLSERQRLTVASAVTVLAAVVLIAAVAALLFLVGAFFTAFSNVFLPLAVAAVAALVLKPYYEWLCSWPRMPAPVALGIVFVSLALPIIALVWFFGALVVAQLTDLIDKLPAWYARASEELADRWPRIVEFWREHPFGQRLREALAAQQQALLDGLQAVGAGALTAGRGFLRWIGIGLAWAVLPVYLAYFLMSTPRSFNAEQYLPFLKPSTRRDLIYLANEFVNIIVAFFRGQLLIALLQGILFAIGFSIVGLRYGLLLGLLLGFLNIIPYLGSIVGLGIALPLALLQEDGGLVRVIAVIVVFTVVQTIEGYLLTPRIMGQRTGLHPMVVIVAIFFWGTALGGISGMILAIPLTAFLVVFWRLLRERYIHEIV